MIIFTGGNSQGNPGLGGFGAVVLDDNENLITTHSEYSQKITNNREELKATLQAFLQYGSSVAAGSTLPIVIVPIV